MDVSLMPSRTPLERFSILNCYLGWGDPDHAIWFVGMEEGEEYKAEDLLFQGLKQTWDTTDNNGTQVFWTEPKLPLGKKGAEKAESFIASSLCDPAEDPETFRRDKLWRAKSQTFHANVYPLGYQRRRGWPAKYESLFGIEAQNDRYAELVAETRFRWLGELAARNNRKCLICFGLGMEQEFTRAFSLSGGREMKESGGRIILFPDHKAIVAPHFSYGHFGRVREAVLATLGEWNVRLS